MATRTWKVRMGTLVEVENKQPLPNANPRYWAGKLQLPSGEEVLVLFTRADVRRAVYRAERNPEDALDECKVLDWIT